MRMRSEQKTRVELGRPDRAMTMATTDKNPYFCLNVSPPAFIFDIDSSVVLKTSNNILS